MNISKGGSLGGFVIKNEEGSFVSGPLINAGGRIIEPGAAAGGRVSKGTALEMPLIEDADIFCNIALAVGDFKGVVGGEADKDVSEVLIGWMYLGAYYAKLRAVGVLRKNEGYNNGVYEGMEVGSDLLNAAMSQAATYLNMAKDKLTEDQFRMGACLEAL